MRTILVVEDDPTQAQALLTKLTRANFSVDIAHDGLEGLELFSGKKYDLIIFDILMPRMEGTEMLRKLQQQHETLPPIIILTNKEGVSEPRSEEHTSELQTHVNLVYRT